MKDFTGLSHLREELPRHKLTFILDMSSDLPNTVLLNGSAVTIHLMLSRIAAKPDCQELMQKWPWMIA